MFKTIIGLIAIAALILLGTQVVQARGMGGASHGGGRSAGESRGGESHSGYSSGGPRGAEHSSSEGAAAGHAAADHNAPKYSGAQGAAAGAAAANHNSPQHSGAQGAAAGAAAANRNSPQYSGAQGAAAGAAMANRNSPQYSGAQGAAAGAAVANRNSPQYPGAQGAAAGYAAANRNSSAIATAYQALPTDAGFGMPVAATGIAASAGDHQTEAATASVYAARGASTRAACSVPGLYGQDWHTAHPGVWAPAGWAAGRAWNATAWPELGASLGWGAAEPVSYNYGADITYQGNQVYYGNQPVATADEYYQQASVLAQSAAPSGSQADDWLPLGVFAFVQKEQAEPHYVMHLAIHKSGAIGGNYSDLVGGATVPIQGAVDKKTQRVAWTVGTNKTTVCETGLYNLTQDEAPALLHIGKDRTQPWLLVRLKQSQ